MMAKSNCRRFTLCIVCNKTLTGKQRVYCSKLCKNKVAAIPAQLKRKRSRKLAIVELRGGKCDHCGYNRNHAALAFHHLSDKEFSLNFKFLANRTMEAVLKELEKCQLLCMNCHHSLHYPHMHKDQIAQKEYVYAPEIPTGESGLCGVCGKALTGKQEHFCSRDCQNVYYQSYENQQKKGMQRKIMLVQRMGGRCVRCAYDENFAALSFHHRRDKRYELDLRNLGNRSLKSIEEEAAKCELVCLNCHMELHNANA